MRSKLTPLAKKNRRPMTDAEFKLWKYLRNRQTGVKFRRQCPIDNCIVDFVCFEKRLIIEVDGSQHIESDEDIIRDKHLKSQNFRVLRFWNTDILKNPEGVVERILCELDSPPPASPSERQPPPSRGR